MSESHSFHIGDLSDLEARISRKKKQSNIGCVVYHEEEVREKGVIRVHCEHKSFETEEHYRELIKNEERMASQLQQPILDGKVYMYPKTNLKISLIFSANFKNNLYKNVERCM